MPPRIPNPKITLPKPRLPKRGAKADAPAPASGEPVAAVEVAADEPVATTDKGSSGRRFGLPSLSLPSLSLPRRSSGSGAAKPAAKSFSRSKSPGDVVGLDIEPGYVVAVQATANGSVKVTKAVGMPIDLEIVRDGEVLDPLALGQALTELFRGSGLGRNVRVGLANQRTVLRTLDLPPIEDRKELAAAVRFQAEEEVPMPLNNAVLDFQPLGLVDTPHGQRQRVVLVAAQRDMVDRLLEALKIAGLRPVGVDLSAFALIRSLYERDGQRGPNLVYLGVGGLTNMAIADGITCKFTRMLAGGVESMAEDLAARREVSVTQARELLFSVGLPAREDEAPADIPVAPPAAFVEAPQEPAAPAYEEPAAPAYEEPAAPAYEEPAAPAYEEPAAAAYDAPAPDPGYADTGELPIPEHYDESYAAHDAGAYDEPAADEDSEVQFYYPTAGEADDGGHADQEDQEDPHSAVTGELPAYDYEEPAPFTDDYVLEDAGTYAPEPAATADVSTPAPERSYRTVDPDDDVHQVIADGVREIAGEVRNSLDFQRIQGGGEPVSGIVLSGPVLDVPGFADALEYELGLPVYRADVEASAGAVSPSLTNSRLAVAAGLAVDEVAP